MSPRSAWNPLSEAWQYAEASRGPMAVDNRTRVAQAGADRMTRTHDALYQLTREQCDGDNSYDVTYTCDAGGNRLTKIDAGDTTTYTYDAANQLSTDDDGTAVAAEWRHNSARRRKGASIGS